MIRQNVAALLMGHSAAARLLEKRAIAEAAPKRALRALKTIITVICASGVDAPILYHTDGSMPWSFVGLHRNVYSTSLSFT